MTSGPNWRFQSDMLKLFGRSRKRREVAPQFTRFERHIQRSPGLPPGSLAYSVYDQMEQDSMIQTALTLKKLGVLAAPSRIVPVSGSDTAKAKAEFAESVLSNMEGSPQSILFQAMDAFAKGWSTQELVWGIEGSGVPRNSHLAMPEGPNLAETPLRRSRGQRVVIRAVKPKDPSNFGLELDAFGNIQQLNLQLPGEAPVALPRSKFIVYRNRSTYGKVRGKSDLDAAYNHWSAKSALLDAWKLHLDKFAMPTLFGRYVPGFSVEDQAALLAALQDIQTRTAILHPDNVSVSTLGGDREASTGYMEAIEFHNREMARAILGQTLTTDEGRRVGSLALGKVHLQVLMLHLESIRKELADLVMTEQVLRPLTELNFGPGEVPRFEFAPISTSAFATGDVG